MGILDAIGSFFSPEEGYEAAEDTLAEQQRRAEAAAQQRWQQEQGYLQPYMNQGQEQYGRLTGAEDALLHPDQLANQWSSNYETSPYARRMLQQNREQGLEAASSMGLSGSSAALNNIQQGGADIMARDRREYLNDLMQKYLAGIGIGQNIYGTGANMAGALGQGAQRQGEFESNLINQYGQNRAGLEYGRVNAPGQLIGNILGAGVDLAGNYLSGLGSHTNDRVDALRGARNRFNQ